MLFEIDGSKYLFILFHFDSVNISPEIDDKASVDVTKIYRSKNVKTNQINLVTRHGICKQFRHEIPLYADLIPEIESREICSGTDKRVRLWLSTQREIFCGKNISLYLPVYVCWT